MIDVVTVGAGGGSIAWLSPEGTLKVGPHSAGADPGPLCYGKGGTERHHHRRPRRSSAGSRRTCSAARSRSTSTRPAPASRRLAKELGLTPEACATGILEISAWNQANALRQVTVKRGLDVRDFALVTFGGSGSLLLCRLMDILGLPDRAGPAEPRQRLGVRPAHGRRQERLRADPRRASPRRSTRPPSPACTTSSAARPPWRSRARASAPTVRSFVRTADLRYFGQAFEVRVPVPEGDLDAAALQQVADAFHAEHRALYGYDFSADPSQQVEWVNLRVSGIGPIKRPEIARHPLGDGGPVAERSRRAVCFEAETGHVDTPVLWRPDLAPGTVVHGPAIIEEFGSTVPLHPGFSARVDEHLNIIVTRESN